MGWNMSNSKLNSFSRLCQQALAIFTGKTVNLDDPSHQGQEITERKQIQTELHHKTAELEAIFKAIPDAVVYADTDHHIVKVNPAFTRLFRYNPEEILNKQSDVLYASREDYKEMEKTRFNQNASEILEPYEVVYHCKDEKLFISETVGTVVKDVEGEPLGYLSIIRNITERKQAEAEKVRLFDKVSQQREQLRALTRRLAETQEAERKALARELHDQVGQNLTALNLNLNIVHGQLADPSPETIALIQDRLNDSLVLLDQTTERIRDVMANLRPPVLDDYGIVAALRWYAKQFAARVDFKIIVRGQEPDPRLATSVEETLFRITQEALTNVAKHAQASQVTMTITTINDTVQLVITDNGIGFEPAGWIDPAKRQSWGLVTMVERAEAIGGRCWVESTLGQGTQVIVQVSLNRSK